MDIECGHVDTAPAAVSTVLAAWLSGKGVGL